MIRISNISFFRFCWENGKLDWPKCARTTMDAQQTKNPSLVTDLQINLYICQRAFKFLPDTM